LGLIKNNGFLCFTIKLAEGKMTYVCSDIHGCYEKYLKLLEQIKFNKSDTLYILGDVLNREGNGGIDILQDIMDRPNVTLILGNHEEIALEGFEFLMNAQVKKASDINDLPVHVKVMLTEWLNLGGMPTIKAFRELSRREQERIVAFCLTGA
jgi:serine/threonine protein phosphatase 1